METAFQKTTKKQPPLPPAVSAPRILSRCDDWVVCVKPVGLDSESAFPALLEQALDTPVWPVHRLDQNVGGLMVYALTAPAARELSRLIQEGQLIKEYVLLCHGTLPGVDGRMEDLRAAVLTWRTLRPAGQDLTLVRVRLETGRSHQIRVQFASRGCPLRGDHKYGARDGEKIPALFSCGLSFPWRGEPQNFEYLPDWAKKEHHP